MHIPQQMFNVLFERIRSTIWTLFELLHKTAALAHLQAFVSFEIHLLSFLSNIDEKLSVYIFIIKKEVQVFC